jgi:hypothetical protein
MQVKLTADVKARIAQTREQDDYYYRWAKWMLEERLQRPVKPFRPQGSSSNPNRAPLGERAGALSPSPE